jgi:hypothetical protein
MRRAAFFFGVVLVVACKSKETAQPEPQPLAAVEAPPCLPVATGFFDDVANGRYPDAYKRTCRGYRAWVTLDQFTTGAKKMPYFMAGQRVSQGSKTVGCTGGANVGTMDVYFEGPNKAAGNVYFAKEDDAWCVTGINAGGNAALPH